MIDKTYYSKFFQDLSDSINKMNLNNYSDSRQEDSGNYTCEIKGENSLVVTSVTHQLLVRGQFKCIKVNFKLNKNKIWI